MQINELIIENFRGYKSLNIKLNSHFNIVIGENGSGKTALLEALTVAMGAFFLGIRNVNARSIHKKDIHIATYEYNEEYLFPVKIEAIGKVGKNDNIHWYRELNGFKNRTTSIGVQTLKKVGEVLESQVRKGELVDLPLLAYYATGRLFDEARTKTYDKKSSEHRITLSSRFRAYDRCLEAKSTYKEFQKWFRGKELARIQKRQEDIYFDLVKDTIVNSIPDCKDIYFEFDPDKPQGLKIQLTDNRILPFSMLSDGTRNFLAIVADIAFKCVTLNPHLTNNAILATQGMVLIDELDLHLHPEWQRQIVNILKNTFPNIQFIVTTHSPFIIQETGKQELIILKENKVRDISSAVGLSIEDIAEEIQQVVNPQWSKSRQYMFEVAKKYYQAVKQGTDTAEMKKELDEAMKPFALDTAYYAIIEQERILNKYRNKSHETNK